MTARIYYLLFRFRRRILFAASIPVLAAFLLGVPVGAVAIGSMTLMALHALRYPHAHHEAIGLAFSGAFGIAAFVFLRAFDLGLSGFATGALALVTSFGVYLATLVLHGMTPLAGWRVQCRWRSRVPSRLDPETLARLLKDQETLGPTEADGFAEYVFEGTRRDHETFEIVAFQEAWRRRIVEDRPLGQTEQMVCPRLRIVATDRWDVVARQNGSWLVTEEISVLPVMDAVMLWLGDYVTDHLVSQVEEAQGDPVLSYRREPIDIFGVTLARAINWLGVEGPPSEPPSSGKEERNRRGPWG